MCRLNRILNLQIYADQTVWKVYAIISGCYAMSSRVYFQNSLPQTPRQQAHIPTIRKTRLACRCPSDNPAALNTYHALPPSAHIVRAESCPLLDIV